MDEASHSLSRLAASTDRVPGTATALGDARALGPEQPGPPPVNVRGQPADLLAWLLGRGSGSTLTVAGDYPLPALPPWR